MKNILIPALLSFVPLQAAEQRQPVKHTRIESVVTIGGQVRRAGPVHYRKDLTLYAAIQAAGGPTEFGSMRRVKVIRNGKATVYDLKNDQQKSVKVVPEDMIEVPQKNIFGR